MEHELLYYLILWYEGVSNTRDAGMGCVTDTTRWHHLPERFQQIIKEIQQDIKNAKGKIKAQTF